MRTGLILSMAIVFATTAFAHNGVKNQAVMTRMDTMGQMKDAIQLMGKMANQAIPFDAAKAAQAKADMIAATSRIAIEFKVEETDPKMEAKPTIWTNWSDFEVKAMGSVQAAQNVQTTSLLDLQQSLTPLGDSCSSCHKAYRIKKK